MRRKKTVFCVLSLTALLCCGCGQNVTSNVSGENVELPSVYNDKINRVKFNTQVIIPEDFDPDELMKTTARKCLPDTEKVKAYFDEKIQGQKVKEKFEEPAETEEGAPYYHVLTEEGTGYSISDGIDFNTDKSYFFQGVLLHDSNGNLPEEYRKVREIPGFLEKEAWEMVQEELSVLGYEAEYQRESIALPHSFSEEKEYWMAKDGGKDLSAYKTEWTEADDSWYFLMRQNLQGLPVYSKNVYLDNTDLDTPIQFLCSRRGIEKIYIDYYFDFQEKKEEVRLLPFDEIAETVAEKNNKFWKSGKYEVPKALLCQFVIQKGKEYEVTPAWIVDVVKTEGKNRYLFTMIVNAVTGEEVSFS